MEDMMVSCAGEGRTDCGNGGAVQAGPGAAAAADSPPHCHLWWLPGQAERLAGDSYSGHDPAPL